MAAEYLAPICLFGLVAILRHHFGTESKFPFWRCGIAAVGKTVVASVGSCRRALRIPVGDFRCAETLNLYKK